MKKIRKVIKLTLDSISSIEFYYHLNRVPLAWSVITYLCFLLMIAIFNSFWFWQITAPQLESQLSESIIQLAAEYPETLVVSWNNQSLTSNLSPVVMAMPLAAPTQLKSAADNFLIINTDNSPNDKTALFTLKAEELTIRSSNQVSQPIQLNSLFSVPFTIDHQRLPQLVKEAQLWLSHIISAAQALFLPTYYFYLILARGISLFFEVTIIYLLFRLNKINRTFLQLLQLSLHLFIPAEVIHQLSLKVMDHPPISFHSVAFWILFLVIFFSQQQARWQKRTINQDQF